MAGRVTDSVTTSVIREKRKANNLDDNKWQVLEPVFSGNEVQCHDSISSHLLGNQAADRLGQLCFAMLTVHTGLNEAFGLRASVFSPLYLYYLEEVRFIFIISED